jgi:hypothetical protein
MPENIEQPGNDNEIKKLSTIATDMDMSNKLRTQAIDRLGDMASHESLVALLGLVANDKLNIDEREFALKRAGAIVKKGR